MNEIVYEISVERSIEDVLNLLKIELDEFHFTIINEQRMNQQIQLEVCQLVSMIHLLGEYEQMSYFMSFKLHLDQDDYLTNIQLMKSSSSSDDHDVMKAVKQKEQSLKQVLDHIVEEYY